MTLFEPNEKRDKGNFCQKGLSDEEKVDFGKMNGMFTRVNNATARSVRNAEVNLQLSLLKLPGGQKCFSYRGAKFWNSIGTEAKNS